MLLLEAEGSTGSNLGIPQEEECSRLFAAHRSWSGECESQSVFESARLVGGEISREREVSTGVIEACT